MAIETPAARGRPRGHMSATKRGRSLASALRERGWHGLRIGLRFGALALLCIMLLHSAAVSPSEYYPHRLRDATSGLGFNFTGWEAEALLRKVGSALLAPQDTLSEPQRDELVRAYIEALGAASRLRAQVTETYSQNGGAEATAQAASTEGALEDLRTWLETRQDVVEGILEEQATVVLQEEGFGRLGYVWPPVKVRFTPLPLLLVTSARDEITRASDVHLEAGLPVAERVDLEAEVDARFEDRRSLVTPIGGVSAYPAMILETDSLTWLADTFAHEWTHHYLVFHVLGMGYSQSTQMTSINETTASIVGREVGRRLILRYYPELADRLPPLPEPPDQPPMTSREVLPPEPLPPGVWDYNREMRETRLRVEELLAEGRVEQAEAYMEQRRREFVAQGHNIRKLNQAWFAFHGSYATSPSTVNPIGGQLEWLRAQKGSLRAFVATVSSIARHEDLLALLPPH
jgi:hypothetical protein